MNLLKLTSTLGIQLVFQCGSSCITVQH